MQTNRKLQKKNRKQERIERVIFIIRNLQMNKYIIIWTLKNH